MSDTFLLSLALAFAILAVIVGFKILADYQVYDRRRRERAKVTKRLRQEIIERDSAKCKRCGNGRGALEVDHIKPISRGGKSDPDNLQTLCLRCNRSKGAKYGLRERLRF